LRWAQAIHINKANKTTQATTKICHLENYEISTGEAPKKHLAVNGKLYGVCLESWGWWWLPG